MYTLINDVHRDNGLQGTAAMQAALRWLILQAATMACLLLLLQAQSVLAAGHNQCNLQA